MTTLPAKERGASILDARIRPLAPADDGLIYILSLGAGVQSSTLALMLEHGDVGPKPHAAVFADTGAEPKHVYEWLDWLQTQLSYPLYRVMRGKGLLHDLLGVLDGTRRRVGQPPFFTLGRQKGILRRNCTYEYKVLPITAAVRAIVGLKPRERAPKERRVVQYIGISYDETIRMKPSREPWIEHRWPLVDQKMTRQGCIDWMDAHHYPRPLRSACTFCPYHSDAEWKALKALPTEWRRIVLLDEKIRTGLPGVKDEAYLHADRKPIAELDFKTAEEAGQRSLFGEECEGMCGV